jgi:hypothetical protein
MNNLILTLELPPILLQTYSRLLHTSEHLSAILKHAAAPVQSRLGSPRAPELGYVLSTVMTKSGVQHIPILHASMHTWVLTGKSAHADTQVIQRKQGLNNPGMQTTCTHKKCSMCASTHIICPDSTDKHVLSCNIMSWHSTAPACTQHIKHHSPSHQPDHNHNYLHF